MNAITKIQISLIRESDTIGVPSIDICGTSLDWSESDGALEIQDEGEAVALFAKDYWRYVRILETAKEDEAPVVSEAA